MIETEKKYRLTKNQQEQVRLRLVELGARRIAEEFEENTIYVGAGLEAGSKILRLRRIGDHAKLTFKQRLSSSSPIKRQREEETSVANPEAMSAILEAVGFTAALVYEKRRETWILDETEIVIDELPFGLFMEVEGKESEIELTEHRLGIEGFEPENATYPQLTKHYGTPLGEVTEARFLKNEVTDS
jgi:adenylate cyclase class 2